MTNNMKLTEEERYKIEFCNEITPNIINRAILSHDSSIILDVLSLLADDQTNPTDIRLTSQQIDTLLESENDRIRWSLAKYCTSTFS